MSADSDYDEEQTALGGQESTSPEIQIQVPAEPETNPEVYRDVEPMLFRGFLTIAAEINEIQFVFKNLNQHEMDILRFMHPSGNANASFWDNFLAYGVFMIEGENILPDRTRWISKIAHTFSSLQPVARNRLIWHISEVNRRAANAVTLTECYATEKYSRYRWHQLTGTDMTSTSVTGIEGTSNLGFNWAQLIWRAINRIEDINDGHEQSWEHAKFVGSCMAGKGISKIYRQDADRKKQAKDAQFARKDQLLRQVLFGEKKEDTGKFGGAVLSAPKTVQELASQLERDLKGEKDWHDRVVDEHEQKIKDGLRYRSEQSQKLARSRDAAFGGKSIIGGVDMKGLTLAQVQERILQQKERAARGEAVLANHPELHDDKYSGILDRYFSDEDSNSSREPMPAFPIIKKR